MATANIVFLRSRPRHQPDLDFEWRPPSNAFLIAFLALVFGGVAALLFQNRGPRFSSVAPGGRLLKVVDFFYSRAAVEETFKPIIADWRTEYFEAVLDGRTWKARWITARYSYAFVMAMGLSSVFSIVRSFLPAGK
jgi:hypothetical protein